MKKFFIFLFLILGLTFYVYQGIYLPKDFISSEERLFSVKKGEGLFEIAENLEKEGFIKSRFFFDFYVIFKKKQKNLQAGDYFLNSSTTAAEIAQKIISGKTAKEKITIIEGWNLKDVGFYFENKGMFQAEELWEIAGFPLIDYSKNTGLPKPKDFSDEYEFLKDKSKNVGLEGYLFPDTYFVSKLSTNWRTVNNKQEMEKIVRMILDNFDKNLKPEIQQEIEKQNKTIFEVITMASLIEKEVRTSEDKKIVSGILWKRLENKIPLQVDATVTYITGKKTTEIFKEDLKIDSPYNTYKYLGLPLGPICNPGLDSILAAVYPENSQYWFYLSAPEGETIFSKTLKEHNINREKYLK